MEIFGISVWTILWFVWFAMFFIIEIPSMRQILRDGKDGTLSQHVWRFMGIGKAKGEVTKAVQIRRIVFMAFWIWLTAHFFFQFA